MVDKKPLQYFANELQPIKIDAASLNSVLGQLRTAVRRSVELIQTNYKGPNVADAEAFGTISYGALGKHLSFV